MTGKRGDRQTKVYKSGAGFSWGLFLFSLGLALYPLFFVWVLFCVWSWVPCLRLCEVDDHTDGALDAADGADFDVADDQAAGEEHHPRDCQPLAECGATVSRGSEQIRTHEAQEAKIEAKKPKSHRCPEG